MKAIVLILIAAAVLLVAYVGRWFYRHLHFPALKILKTATEDQRLAQIDRWLRSLHDRHEFNGGVLIGRDGGPLLMTTYGFTDHTAEHELTTRSSFRLASVSKQFTAAGILVLVEQGRIGLDHPVTEHLNGFPYPDVTVRHLLNHTSGIPDVYMRLAKKHRGEVGDVLRITDVPELIQKYPPERRSQSGRRFAYSNTNYVLLAAVIEEVSKLSFERFMQEELFEPLGMTNSRVWTLLSSAPFPSKASDFDQMRETRTEVTPTWIDGIAGDGAVFCSLEDMLIWNRFWLGNPLISADLMAKAFEPPTLDRKSRFAYGFGWVIKEHRVGHGGRWLGAHTYVMRYHDRNTCLVVLDNSSNLRIGLITRQLEKAITPLLSQNAPSHSNHES